MLLVIITERFGMDILDRPISQSEGAKVLRKEQCGTRLTAIAKIFKNGVPYAVLVPREPNKPEYMRIAERDNSIVFAEVIEIEPETDKIAEAIKELTEVVRTLKP